MAGGETVKSLLQQLVSYHWAVWRRAWSDTWQALGAKMRLTLVLLVCGVVNAYVIDSYMGRPGEIGLVLHDGFWAAATLCGTFGTALLVYFLFYLFFTPSRIYGDNQKEIVELKSQMGRPLSLYVNIPSVFLTTIERFPPLRHLYRENLDREIPEKECLDRGSLVILLRGLRLINRSRAHRVSLSLTLRVRLDDWLGYQEDIENPDYLEVQAYQKFYEGVSPGQYLCNPIDIEPEGTEDGTMCFLISAEILKVHEVRKLVNPKSCLLDITDHVSGEKITKNIDQRLVESTTAQVVK